MKRSMILAAVLSAIILCGCGDETELAYRTETSEITASEQTAAKTEENLIYEPDGDPDYIFGGITDTAAKKQEETEPVQTEFADEILQILDGVELPEINITENSTAEEIMLAGKTAGMYYGEEAEKYFGYGGYYDWAPNYDESIGHYRSDGLYTDTANNVYVPMDYAGEKKFLISRLNLTEKGFEELCENSPSSYYDVNGSLCVTIGDGGQAGWDYSYITDYELGENTVTYNCVRVGLKENWGYDEDMTEPFTFRLALNDGVWKLDGCSYGEGFFYRIIGLESDIDEYISTDFDSVEEIND